MKMKCSTWNIGPVLHGVTKIYEKKEAKLHVEHCARRSDFPTFQIITPILSLKNGRDERSPPTFISLVLLRVPR